MIAIGDSIPDGSWDFLVDVEHTSIPNNWPGTVHRGGANILFCDGHVTWYLQRELTDFSGSSSSVLPRRRLWHNDYIP